MDMATAGRMNNSGASMWRRRADAVTMAYLNEKNILHVAASRRRNVVGRRAWCVTRGGGISSSWRRDHGVVGKR